MGALFMIDEKNEIISKKKCIGDLIKEYRKIIRYFQRIRCQMIKQKLNKSTSELKLALKNLEIRIL